MARTKVLMYTCNVYVYAPVPGGRYFSGQSPCGPEGVNWIRDNIKLLILGWGCSSSHVRLRRKSGFCSWRRQL